MTTNSKEYNRAYHARRSPEAKTRKVAIQTARRREIAACISNIKATRPCFDCHTRYPAVCMDFDHLPGKGKMATVSNLARSGAALTTIFHEIAKCDLVCSNCHRIRTATRRSICV